MKSPFVSLSPQVFGSDVMIRAEHVTYVEVVRAQSGIKLAIGLAGGGTIDSFVWPPDDATLTRAREHRDTIVNDLTEKLTPDTPNWRELPPAGA